MSESQTAGIGTLGRPSMRPGPWWANHLDIHPLRRLFHSPAAIVGPYVSSEMTVLEPGSGTGFFTLELARQVGDNGHVVAVDSRPQMLYSLSRRARRAGLIGRIQTRLIPHDHLGVEDLAGTVDFILAFDVVHLRLDSARFFQEAAIVLKTGGKILLAESRGRFSEDEFMQYRTLAVRAGLRNSVAYPRIYGSHAVVLFKP